MRVSFFVLLLLTPANALADNGDLEVIETNAPGIVAGAHLTQGMVISLPTGSAVQFYDGTRKTTLTCNGPYMGPVAECPGAPTCGFFAHLFKSCSGDKVREGGVRGNE